MSRHLLAATIAHEDEQLGTRKGAFDLADFQARAQAYFQGKPDPSGSTIPQQLVKNIFLWDDQSAARKGIEAVLATQFSYTLSPQRTLELYLNYAQFGPRLYGVCAASWYYFATPPWNLSDYQSAQLMGVLPLPRSGQTGPQRRYLSGRRRPSRRVEPGERGRERLGSSAAHRPGRMAGGRRDGRHH